jgi:hypothetical protein
VSPPPHFPQFSPGFPTHFTTLFTTEFGDYFRFRHSHGVPQHIRSDNGPESAAKVRRPLGERLYREFQQEVTG